MISFPLRPVCWLWIAIGILVPLQFSHVLRDPSCSLPPKPIGDGPDYECIGYSLSIGQGYAFQWDDEQWKHPYLQINQGKDYVHVNRDESAGYTASRPPFLPWLISIVYRIVPRGPTAFTAIRLISALSIALSGAIGVWVATTLAVRMFPENAWPVLFAGSSSLSLAILDRTIRTYAMDFLSEPLAMLATSIFCAISIGLPLTRKPGWRYVWMGGIYGWMILIRSMFIFWLPGIVCLVILSSLFANRSSNTCEDSSLPCNRHSVAKSFWFAALFSMTVILVISPWCYRNIAMLGQFMPLGTQGVSAILGGYSEESLAIEGNWSPEPERRIREKLEKSADWYTLNSMEREKRIAATASIALREWISTHQPEIRQLVFMRLKTHWGPYRGTSLLWRIGVLLGVIALCLFRRPEGWWLIGMLIVSSLVVMCLYETGGRFLVPLYGMLYALAGIGIATCVGFSKFSRKRLSTAKMS